MGPVSSVTVDDTVAVIIPTYNSASTIERALNSLAAQTHQPDEVIVVDNNSTDSTVEVIHRFADIHPSLPIRVEPLLENMGPGFARNAGWQHSSSSLISFLDSDDSWHPQKLEIMLRVAKSHPNHVLFGHRYEVSTSNSRRSERPFELGLDQLVYYSLRHFLIRNRLSTPTVIVRRTVPFRFRDESWFAEDYWLWTLIVAEGTEAVFLDLPLAYLHKSPYGESGLSAKLPQMHVGELEVVRHLRQVGKLSTLSTVLTLLWLRVKYLRRRYLKRTHD
jgi:glycosyltransferase involved in cell wall biosynthesis